MYLNVGTLAKFSFGISVFLNFIGYEKLISKFERTVKMTLSVDNLFRKLQEKTAGKLTNNPTIEEKNIINSTMRNRSVYSRDGYNRSLSNVNLNSVLQNDYISKKLSYVNNYV